MDRSSILRASTKKTKQVGKTGLLFCYHSRIGESNSACIARVTKRASGTFRRARAPRADASKPRGCAQRIRRSILRASTRIYQAGSATDLPFCCCMRPTKARRIGARKTGFAPFALKTVHRTVFAAPREPPRLHQNSPGRFGNGPAFSLLQEAARTIFVEKCKPMSKIFLFGVVRKAQTQHSEPFKAPRAS